MMAVLMICLVWDGEAYDLFKAFVLVAPIKAHGKCDVQVT